MKKNIKFIIFVICILLIRLNCWFVINIVQGNSMLPNLTEGQVLIGSSIADYERGDIVVANHDEIIIKRIIGLPNETVECIEGKVYINGVLLEESYIEASRNTLIKNWKYELGPDEYFICGDNRDVSYDSRYYGPIHKSEIMEKIYIQF